MQNVRIAQIGQVAVNRPFYEVFINGKRFAAVVNKSGKVEFVPPRFLKEIGIGSVYADTFRDSLDSEVITAMNISGTTTVLDSRFAVVNYGTGLAFVADFLPYKGWSGLNPTASITINA
ncbi:hypothetical protein GO755_32865 [Spirosoma sp. HMF4905]|uniref:Uncharacterized protein n=1 Tax=Spirosoma arboris TaxID=2682092 RepID=A0A7K1SM55_9BACT|nr:hypothetical protein [Spirosoma arboris]MVM34867.1 hypothetical protein [Spirosoma arboris]